jgi:hypothetical protein
MAELPEVPQELIEKIVDVASKRHTSQTMKIKIWVLGVIAAAGPTVVGAAWYASHLDWETHKVAHEEADKAEAKKDLANEEQYKAINDRIDTNKQAVDDNVKAVKDFGDRQERMEQAFQVYFHHIGLHEAEKGLRSPDAGVDKGDDP